MDLVRPKVGTQEEANAVVDNLVEAHSGQFAQNYNATPDGFRQEQLAEAAQIAEGEIQEDVDLGEKYQVNKVIPDDKSEVVLEDAKLSMPLPISKHITPKNEKEAKIIEDLK